MSKVGKIVLSLFIICIIMLSIVILYIVNIIINTPSLKLNLNALEEYNTELSLYDNSDKLIQNVNTLGNPTININSLPQHTIDAFLCIEDTKFYEHNGLNYGRILRAGINNLLSGYPKEGASTITQQLIKNTHLTSEKTLDRKIREAYLALQLERQFTKDEILNTYLNILYFGNGLYGIENASLAFFGHSSSNLTIAESATLAGIIKSPAKYSPILNKENCITRRNLVLEQMLKYNKITQYEYNQSIKAPLDIKEETITSENMYSQMVYRELLNILNLTEREIMNKGLKIYTYFDANAQSAINKGYLNLNENTPNLNKIIMMLDNSNNSVVAYSGSTIDNNYRQCGSLIKPFLCYGSALEKQILYPISQILDKEINYNGYTPQNVDNKYHGWVSMRYALTHSLNIPAVKTLDYVGLDYAKKFASKFGIEFTPNDNHLALALGAMERGTTIQQMADCYMTLANNGKYAKSKFIRKIIDRDGNIIYSRPQTQPTIACSESTSFMINDILLDCSKYGTAKKIGSLNFPIASKTGTVGATDNTNTDAWCVSYNPQFTCISWCGNTTGDTTLNLKKNQNGGTICSNSIYTALKNLKDIDLTQKFIKPNNVSKHFVDKDILLNEHRIMLIDTDSGYNDYFLNTHLPLQNKTKITPTIYITHNKTDNSISWQNIQGTKYIVNALTFDNKKINLPFNTSNFTNTVKLNDNIKKIWVTTKINNTTIESNYLEFYQPPTKTSLLKKLGKLWLN